MKAFLIGILSSAFFACTFILNRSMELSGGSWLWSASLRYFFMIPFLILIAALRRNLKELLRELVAKPLPWLLWSFVGFGLFYAPITYAAASGPGWLVAGTWQFTIIAGILLTPLFLDSTGIRRVIPLKSLLFSSLIFMGIIILQLENAENGLTLQLVLTGMLPVVIAAFAYPLGNRKMMELYTGKLDTFQRVLGMTLASMPLWIILAVTGYATVGAPSSGQIYQTLLVALTSGVIATLLFFFATELVKDDSGKLAAVEATQSSQVVFVIVGEMLFLSIPLPSMISFIGILLVVTGMVLHSLINKQKVWNNRKANRLSV
ncbi:drug/metabolite transporter (DMT)-like permease [Bacillus mesophilus]|uniref:Multidrug resistance efflux transporter family protein n=1 Tax=Bacillus mesophilus TaxID=1808955 RepID=A0A6M0Q7A7_9BACI|nr:multidrug resistance efflux transporter family protein [Bacillus mesophilus]MBM7661553.1 drug/metabolite transporter (DMT)-like permease [Bacillus mesophilus]NEY72222.1 multidrug resistance efflux transporter family protein [Bacillus mesophilus]